MVVFSMRVFTPAGRRQDMLALVETLLAPTRVEPGCESCRLYVDADDPSALTLIEEWSSQPALERHLRSDARKRLIATMEMSHRAPQVHFDTVVRRDGLAALERALAPGPPGSG
jgi:quinol monooxygenase YgiN